MPLIYDAKSGGFAGGGDHMAREQLILLSFWQGGERLFPVKSTIIAAAVTLLRTGRRDWARLVVGGGQSQVHSLGMGGVQSGTWIRSGKQAEQALLLKDSEREGRITPHPLTVPPYMRFLPPPFLAPRFGVCRDYFCAICSGGRKGRRKKMGRERYGRKKGRRWSSGLVEPGFKPSSNLSHYSLAVLQSQSLSSTSSKYGLPLISDLKGAK